MSLSVVCFRARRESGVTLNTCPGGGPGTKRNAQGGIIKEETLGPTQKEECRWGGTWRSRQQHRHWADRAVTGVVVAPRTCGRLRPAYAPGNGTQATPAPGVAEMRIPFDLEPTLASTTALVTRPSLLRSLLNSASHVVHGPEPRPRFSVCTCYDTWDKRSTAVNSATRQAGEQTQPQP